MVWRGIDTAWSMRGTRPDEKVVAHFLVETTQTIVTFFSRSFSKTFRPAFIIDSSILTVRAITNLDHPRDPNNSESPCRRLSGCFIFLRDSIDMCSSDL